jgi:putative transposase
LGKLKLSCTVLSLAGSKSKPSSVTKKADGYYLTLSVGKIPQFQRFKPDFNPRIKITGIDVGLKDFLTTSENEDCSNLPQHYRKAQKRLRTNSDSESRAVKKGSNRRQKASKVNWENTTKKLQISVKTFTFKTANALLEKI